MSLKDFLLLVRSQHGVSRLPCFSGSDCVEAFLCETTQVSIWNSQTCFAPTKRARSPKTSRLSNQSPRCEALNNGVVVALLASECIRSRGYHGHDAVHCKQEMHHDLGPTWWLTSCRALWCCVQLVEAQLILRWGCREHFVSGCWHSSGRDRGRYPQGLLVIYFGSAASWRPCNVVWPHQGPVPHS